MAINKISGNILQDNLVRGTNLAFQTDLLYVDVFNNRIGINTSSATHTLTVQGTAKIANLEFIDDTISTAGNLTILPSGNIDVSLVNIANLAEPVIASDAATKQYVDNSAGNVNFDISDGINTQNILNGDTITFIGNVNEIAIAVEATDNVRIGLPADVIIANALTTNGNLAVLGNIATLGNVDAAGKIESLTDIISGNTVSAITFIASGNITGGNLSILGSSSTVGNLDAGNLITPGEIVATGNVTGANVISLGSVQGSSADISGNISGGNITTVGVVEATGNISGGNITTVGVVEATGNISGGNITTVGVVEATGNISGGNITTVGVVEATGNVIGGNLIAIGEITGTTANITGNVVLGNITIANTTISTAMSLANITLAPGINGEVIVQTTSGMVLPVGNTAQRPSPAATGTVRFNTQTQRAEIYDGTQWDSIVSGVENQIIIPDGSSSNFTLDRESTAAAILVAINGVVQIPGLGYAYTVTGNTISFTSTPLISDIIDIRFL